jgi:hypothetical protein
LLPDEQVFFFFKYLKKLKKYTLLYSLVLVISFILIGSCAKIGSPYGGPKDEDPPKVVKTVPPDRSTNFIPRKSITITFDEYIKLVDIFNELIISPPLEDRAIAQVKGNKVVVELPKDVTFDTTTYTISFGNSIVDNNENNILENYSYVFSLKDYLDSMSVEGRLVNSFDHKPSEERFLVMLYKNLNDSAPLLERPKYIDRTDETGNFAINNIEIGTYRLFALKDANANLIFDLQDETIAFSDSLVKLTPERFKDDIVISDSTLLAQIANADSIQLDSLQTDSILRSQSRYTYFTEMVFFTQELKNQYMIDYLRPQPEKLFFSFNEPVADTFSITPLNYIPSDNNWYLPDISKENDTMIFWLLDTTMISRDSLQFQVQYPVYDSLEQLFAKIDTLYLTTKREVTKENRKRKDKARDEESTEIKPDHVKYINLLSNVKNRGTLDLNKPITFSLNSPIETFRPEQFSLMRLVDTLEVNENFTLGQDSSSMYRMIMGFTPEELTDYKIQILDNAITDIYGETNDTTVLSFKTQAEDYYGVLSVHINHVHEQVIVQLLNEEEKILKQDFIESDQTIRYPYLTPKKYLLKAIIDRNGNGKWDTGNYLKKIQPERVIYFKSELNVRANWEIEMSWFLDY